MDGPSLISFSVARIPNLVDDILNAAKLTVDDVGLFLLHQATYKMLEQLAERLGLSEDKMPIVLRHCGNTVSSTIPIVIDQLRSEGSLAPGSRHMLSGFGVGWSCAGCIWEGIWSASPTG